MTPMTDRPDVVVLGCGIFGAALSWHLAVRRSQTVCTIDLDCRDTGRGATAASAGILTYPGWDPWDLDVVRRTREEYRALCDGSGVGEFRPNGGLRLTGCEEGAVWIDRILRVLVRNGVEAERLDRKQVDALLPGGGPEGTQAALFTPGDAVFSTAGVASAYIRGATRVGAEFARTSAPPRILRSGGRWQVELGSRTIDSGALVLACGAWTKRILEGLGCPLPMAPFRAQACRLRPRPLLAPFPTIHDIDLGLYVRPAAEGRLLAGDGTERVESDPDRVDRRADLGTLERIVTDVGALFPGTDSFAVEHGWAGVCVASPDRYPLVGPVPGAPRLFIATGFNGFGAMRAGGLAGLLAEGIVDGAWEGLAPANPERFPEPILPFAPQPEFPLESVGEAEYALGPTVSAVTVTSAPLSLFSEEASYRSLRSPIELEGLCLSSLSEWFDPFLPLFLREALRTHGTVEVAEVEGGVRGIYLQGTSEGVGSLFTRTRWIAEHFLSRLGPQGAYSEGAWIPGGDPIDILAADLRDWPGVTTLRNPVRMARAEDLPAVRALAREVGGAGDDSWFATLPRPEETLFLCELDGRVVGMSGLTRVGAYARGHSFLVHPRYRGLGIGTDLLQARMLWLSRTGGRQVVSEIYDGNIASHIAAGKAGMAVVGRMYHYRPNRHS